MDGTKLNKGPEFPADLQWLQGAKNPRKENETEGTLSSDTTTNVTDLAVATTEPAKVDIYSSSAEKVTSKSSANGTFSNDTVDRIIASRKEIFINALKKHSCLSNESIKKPYIAFFIMLNGKKFSSDEIEIILDKIHYSVLDLANNKSDIVPKISHHRTQSGIILVYCKDDITLNWLKNIDFKILLPHLDFEILSSIDIVTPTTVKVYIPGPTLSNDSFFHLFEKQNESIKTDNWVVTERKEEAMGTFLKIQIDHVSWQHITKAEMKLFCGASRVAFNTNFN